jgi:hypothetical protein
MGEYIKYKGHEIKLGTCESMYYARLDQLKEARFEMEKMGGNLDIAEYLDPKNGFRYRFPFPDEDNIQIGDFEEYDKGLVIQLHPDDYSIAEFDHYDKWSECHPQGGGYNVNVCHPCPQSPKIDDFKHSPITWRIVAIKQQKQVDGEIWVVIGCPYCGALVRLPYEDAIKLVHSIEAGYVNQHDQTDSNKAYYQEVVRRILAGYTKIAVVS